MNGNQAVQYDAPRNQSVETPNGFIFRAWTRRELANYRMTVLGWPSERAWQRFDEHTHNLQKETKND